MDEGLSTKSGFPFLILIAAFSAIMLRNMVVERWTWRLGLFGGVSTIAGCSYMVHYIGWQIRRRRHDLSR